MNTCVSLIHLLSCETKTSHSDSVSSCGDSGSELSPMSTPPAFTSCLRLDLSLCQPEDERQFSLTVIFKLTAFKLLVEKLVILTHILRLSNINCFLSLSLDKFLDLFLFELFCVILLYYFTYYSVNPWLPTPLFSLVSISRTFFKSLLLETFRPFLNCIFYFNFRLLHSQQNC